MVLISGCGSGAGDNEPVAKYKGVTLTRKALSLRMPPYQNSSDSARFASMIIEDWKREQVMLAKANEQLDDIEPLITFKLEDYKNKLILFEFEKKLMAEMTDTLVKQEEIIKYYKENTAQFLATSNLYLYHYVKTANEDTPELTKRMKSTNEADKKVVRDWVTKYATTYKLDSTYLDGASIAKIESETGVNTLKDAIPGGRVQVMSTDNAKGKFLHFFYLIDVKRTGQLLPIEAVTDDIRSLILNRRRTKFIEDYQTKAYNEARANNDFE